MSLANTADRYGSVSKTLHWLTALLILTLIPSGIIANGLPFETSEELARKAFLFSIHKTFGVTVFFVALARILWALSQTKPGGLHPDRKLETWAAETVHWLLYGSLVLVPLSGWIHHAATTGFAPIWWPFGQSLPFVPKDTGVADTFAGLHLVFEKVLLGALGLHIAGALKHHVIDKDATLKRMWFGQADLPATTGGHSHATPILGAVGAWVAALFIGGSMGMYSGHSTAAVAPQLEAVQSDWQVVDGTLGIKTIQFNQEVAGNFADWTAAIQFNPNVEQGKAGDVDVTVSIGSLTLGSVTGQAMAPDYFDAETFPTARFVADIEPITDGYVAKGTLTIKDQTLPVELPFGLSIDGNRASMTGMLSLDRRDFGIGANMQDEGQLQFGVVVEVSLTAEQPAES